MLSKLTSCSSKHGRENSSKETSGRGQKRELRNKTLGKHVGQHRGERRRPRRQMEGTKVEGSKKKKGDESVANNGPAAAKEGWL